MRELSQEHLLRLFSSLGGTRKEGLFFFLLLLLLRLYLLLLGPDLLCQDRDPTFLFHVLVVYRHHLGITD